MEVESGISSLLAFLGQVKKTAEFVEIYKFGCLI